MKLTAGKRYAVTNSNLRKGGNSLVKIFFLLSVYLFCNCYARCQCSSITSQPVDQADCDGNQVNFSTTISGGTPSYTYTWYYKRPVDASFTILSTTLNSTSTTNILSVANIGNTSAPTGTQYYVVITDVNGCSITSNTVTLTVNGITGISPSTQNIAICQGGSYTLTASTTGNVVSYQWTLNGVDIPGATSATLSITNATSANNGSYKIRVVFNVVGAGVTTCQRTSQLIRNLAVITPTISGFANVCTNSSQIYSTETGKTGYTWTVTGGTITSGTGTNSVNVTWGASGTGVINLSYTDPTAGCTATPTSLNVTINPKPASILIYHN